VKLFLIGRGKDNPDQFLFYESPRNRGSPGKRVFQVPDRGRGASASFQTRARAVLAAVAAGVIAQPPLSLSGPPFARSPCCDTSILIVVLVGTWTAGACWRPTPGNYSQ
jgi:hypothetical protein